MIRRGTTPTVTVTTDADLAGCRVEMTISNAGRRIVKSGDDLRVEARGCCTTVSATLTQEETLSLDPAYPARVQLRFGCGPGVAATGIAALRVDDVLNGEVM